MYKKTLVTVSSFLMLVCVLMIPSSNLLAEELVPASTVRSELSELFDYYDVEFEFSETSETQYTRTEVNEQLMKLESSLKTITKEYTATDAIVVDVQDDIVTPNSLTHEHKYVSSANVNNVPTGNAIIEITCIGVISNSDGTFKQIRNISTRQFGTALNFISWTQISSSYSFYDNTTKADVRATGTLVTEADLLGQKLRQTFDYVIGMKINRV